MKTFKVTIMTPEKTLYSDDVTKFKCENDKGQFEILYNHIDYVSLTVPTITEVVDSEGNKKIFFTASGVVKLIDNNLVLCCASGELSSDIDLERAKKAKERAQERLKEKENVDIERVELALRRASLRIKAAQIEK